MNRLETFLFQFCTFFLNVFSKRINYVFKDSSGPGLPDYRGGVRWSGFTEDPICIFSETL